MSRVEMNIDTRIYPLEIIHSALNTLDESIDASLAPLSDTEVMVCLGRGEQDIGDGNGSGNDIEMQRSLHRALIAAQVADHAFRRAQPIRNYLAQTAFSITSQNQQTIEEFTAGLVDDDEQKHAGAAAAHTPERLEAKPDCDETECGNRWHLDEQSGQVVVWIDTSAYVLPEILWAMHEMGKSCPCSVLNRSDHQISVVMEPQGEAPERRVASFERWLVTAREHLQ